MYLKASQTDTTSEKSFGDITSNSKPSPRGNGVQWETSSQREIDVVDTIVDTVVVTDGW